MKRRFLQHLENTPEIKFECQKDKQLSNILQLYFQIFQIPSSFLETFTVAKFMLIQLTFSNVRWVPLRQFLANGVKVLEP